MAHISTQEWTAFRRRTLANDQLLRVGGHLRDCGECRYAQQRPETPSVLDEAAPLHLTYEQLSGYADAASKSGWKAVEEHLAFCSSCAAELQDLRAFDAQVTQPSSASWWTAVRDFFAMPQSPLFTGAAASLAMAGVAILAFVAGPDVTQQSTGMTSDSYLGHHVLNLTSIVGALLALTGFVALAYRFTAGKRK